MTQWHSQGKCWNTPKQETILIPCFKGLYLPLGGQAEGGSKHISIETLTHWIKGSISQRAFCETGPPKVFWEEGFMWTSTWENREYYFLSIEIHIPKSKNKKHCKNNNNKTTCLTFLNQNFLQLSDQISYSSLKSRNFFGKYSRFLLVMLGMGCPKEPKSQDKVLWSRNLFPPRESFNNPKEMEIHAHFNHCLQLPFLMSSIVFIITFFCTLTLSLQEKCFFSFFPKLRKGTSGPHQVTR